MVILTLILTFLTLCIVAYQVYLMYKQLAIMKKQDELLSLKSNLSIFGEYNTTKSQFEFFAENKGNKGAVDFYWHILVPISLSNNRNMRINPVNIPTEATAEMPIDGVMYKDFNAPMSEKLYPTRQKPLANFPLPDNKMTGGFKFYWFVVGEDGIFPYSKDNKSLGTFTIVV
jgi:hypothetical protein